MLPQPELVATTASDEAQPPVGPARTTVVLADPDPLARRVMRDHFQAGPHFTVAAEASDGVEAVELALHYRPGILLIEPSLARLSSLQITERVVTAAPEVGVVVLTAAVPDSAFTLLCLRAGALGFMSKELELDAIVDGMRAVARGEAAISPAATVSLIGHLRGTPVAGEGMRPVKSALTTREWEVLDLLATGATTAQLARTLFLAEDTVYSHVKNIMRKLGVHTRAEAVLEARRLCGASPAASA